MKWQEHNSHQFIPCHFSFICVSVILVWFHYHFKKKEDKHLCKKRWFSFLVISDQIVCLTLVFTYSCIYCCCWVCNRLCMNREIRRSNWSIHPVHCRRDCFLHIHLHLWKKISQYHHQDIFHSEQVKIFVDLTIYHISSKILFLWNPIALTSMW